MTRKNRTMLKLITSIMLVLLLCLSAALPAFAAGNPIYGTEKAPAEVAITKLFKMPVGTTTPNFTFTFNIEPKSVDGSMLAADLETAPIVGPQGLIFTAEDTGTIIDTGADAYKVIIKETDSIFEGADWKHAGIYVYTVTEVRDTFENTFAEQMYFSQAEYEIWVYVMEKADGSGFYVHMIADYIVATDASSDGEVGDKIDPTPGGGEGYDYSQMMFTNVYIKNNGGTDPDNTVFKLKKEVEGELANKTLLFDFDVKITKPFLVDGTPKYFAYVMDENGNVVTDITKNAPGASIAKDDEGRPYIIFTSGDTLKVSLAHGQWLSFIDMPVGTLVEVMEAGAANYLPKYTVTLYEKTKHSVTGVKSNSLGFGADKNFEFLGEGVNTADFLNKYETTSPMGISADNLPYIVLIAVGLLALGGFAAFMFRKKSKYQV